MEINIKNEYSLEHFQSGCRERGMQMQEKNSYRQSGSYGRGKDTGEFVSIGKKISRNFGQTIMVCCIILGVIASVLSYISSVNAVSETINNTSDVAAYYVSASLQQYIAVAFEAGSNARLASPDRSLSDKAEIMEQRIKVHDFKGGYLLDSNGIDMFTGEDHSHKDYFREAMKGNTYVSTPAYDEMTQAVSYVVSAPLWEAGIPETTPIGAVVYIPDGEFLNDIMRSIKVGKGGTAFMLDANGITIADVDSSLVGVEDSIALGDTNPRLKKYSEICKRMITGESGTGTYSYNGKTKVVAFSPVPGVNGWSIGVAAVRNEFLRMFFLSLALTILFVIAFTIYGIRNGVKLGRRIVQPISVVVKRLELLSEGDLHSETPVPQENDETAILMNSLTQTVQDLRNVITDIDNHLADLSQGNFLIRIDHDYKGDFAEISRSFRTIVEALSSAMRDIDSNAKCVQRGAGDLSGAAQHLAEGATDQASAVEELTATITDISEKISVNAKNAEKARTIVVEMNNQIMESNEHMKNNTEAMDKIREASDKIAEIISSIEEIADQTALLALNASIEAARAGEHGRGFGVVATQVGALADQSSEAARNTKDLIQNAIAAVEEGIQFANATAKSLVAVVENVKVVNESMEEIAIASDNQAEAAVQISDGISQIAEVVETNSATSEESAAASEELSRQADLLKELVERFQFENN